MNKEKYLAIIKNKEEKTKKQLLKQAKKQVLINYRQDWKKLNASIKLSAGGIQSVRSWGKGLEKIVNKLNKKYPFLSFEMRCRLGGAFVTWWFKEELEEVSI